MILRRSDVVTHADHGDARYILIDRRVENGTTVYGASLSVGSASADVPRTVTGTYEQFTKVGPSLAESAESVRRFLYVRSGMGGVDPEDIAMIGDLDTGELVELRVGDLAALVFDVLGRHAVVVDEPRAARARRGARASAQLRADIPDMLAAERRSIERLDADEETS